MGLGYRIFFIDDNDSLKRISMAQYERLFRREHGECLKQYSGKRVRCAMVVISVQDRKPQSITWIDCHRIPFDKDGRLDYGQWEKEMRLIGDLLDPIFKEERRDNIIDARNIFAKKRYDSEVKWSLTAQIEDAIEKAIFGKSL